MGPSGRRFDPCHSDQKPTVISIELRWDFYVIFSLKKCNYERGKYVKLAKPKKLNEGDTIATVSPCWGVAGEEDTVWKYNIGKK